MSEFEKTLKKQVEMIKELRQWIRNYEQRKRSPEWRKKERERAVKRTLETSQLMNSKYHNGLTEGNTHG